MVDTRISKNSPVSVTIGATTYTGVVLVAMKIQGIDGGPMVKARSVANVHYPIGLTDFPKEIIVVVTLDADILPALITANYVNPTAANTALSAFVITEKNTAGLTRTVTFTGANSKIQGVQAKNATLGDQIHEVTILTHSVITYSGWS
jgi:hypothetical protein